MPVGFKNAEATYQRAMTRIFDNLIYDKVECYVDDLVFKSKDRYIHVSKLHSKDYDSIISRLTL
ncbi:hypothetical protein AXF42_Ash013403 [Apostasia shenzhenica]|uniref:Reverse transcriptase domain-containing protein n=1 Tax=Apostasia shenzhenica TaxID=1088818 RepID=A0A2I0A455_9ASPA|nr:hypothetical protein AXF42_Ash013403 [Apostasia shenzhenica]